MIESLSSDWQAVLADQFRLPYFQQLQAFLAAERRRHQVFPPAEDVFTALRLTPPDNVKVLILGQDPYHDDGQAHGLSFSVRRGIRLPPSLRNIFKELEADLGIPVPAHGCLTDWAAQGVLMLNTVLTVRAHAANSHRRKGWEELTTRIIQHVNEDASVAFVLWGRPAQQKADLIDSRHLVIQTAHPSPLSARRGFLGSRPFSKINAYLETNGHTPIDWQLTD